jgi:hypothetical protein
MRVSKRKAEAEKLMLRRVEAARFHVIHDLVEHALSLAPAAALMGDAAPAHVKIAAEIASLDDAADHDKPALRFLLAVMLHQPEGTA